jgi:hypothetical protein
MSEKAPCKVRITGCSFEQGWYRNLIGEEFETDNAGGIYDFIVWEDYSKGHESTWRHISKKDCVVIERFGHKVIGPDNICPTTGEPCLDECCPPGAICNLSDPNDKISPVPPTEKSAKEG